jgi:hypothetical protein
MRRSNRDDGATKAKLVDAAVLDLYEEGEFEGVKYRLLKPLELPENPGKKYPMILSVHGAAGTGHDNVRNLREWNTVRAQEGLRCEHSCFVVVPQSTEPWRTLDMAVHYTDEKIAATTKDWQGVVSCRRNLLQNPKGGNLDRVFLLIDELASEVLKVGGQAAFWGWGRGRPFDSAVTPVAALQVNFSEKQWPKLVAMALSDEVNEQFNQPVLGLLAESGQACTTRARIWLDEFWHKSEFASE